MINLKKTFVIIMSGGKGERLDPLTRDRTKPAVPFGGIYRIIDFSLSNAINSHLRKILVLVQYKCNSLNRHLRDGWDILSPALGEYIEWVPPQQRVKDTWYLGTADSVYQNLYSVEKEDPEYVIILAGDHIYKMDYSQMLKYHIEKQADITIGTVEMSSELAHLYGIIGVDEKDKIVKFQEKPKENPYTLPGNPKSCLVSMGIYILKTQVLYDVLNSDAADKSSSHDFGKDVIPNAISNKNTFAYHFIDENTGKTNYWRDVGTIDTYYQANMDLVAITPEFNLYDTSWPIRTYQVQAPPPKFVFSQEGPGGRMGVALDSLICQGCIISGGRVQSSILSPNVRVNSYAHVEGSILFEGVQVGRHAKIKRTIIDKDVKIPEGMQIGYNLEEDRKRFTVSENGIVVISKGEIL